MPAVAPTDTPPYPPADESGRDALLEYARSTPIAFGTWRGLKGLYKRVEADAANADPAILGMLISRMDTAGLTKPQGRTAVLELGSGFNNVANFLVRGSVGYALNGSGLIGCYELDGPEPLKPRRMGFLRINGTSRIVLAGKDTLVAFGAPGQANVEAVVVDVSDPAKPQRQGSVKVLWSGPTAAYGDHVFFATAGRSANEFTGIRALSVADPDNPAIVGELAVPNAYGVLLSADGWLAGVITTNVGFSWNRLPKAGGVRLIEVPTPSRPRVIGSLDQSQIACGAISGDYLYVGSGPQLLVYDISNPAKPQQRGRWRPRQGGNVTAVAVRGGYAYVGLNWGGINVVDVREPANLVTVGDPLGGYSYNGYSALELAGDTLYAIPNWGEAEVWNLTNPAKPVRAGMPPSPETMGYMKRRARRLLRFLGKEHPARYADAAYHALRSAGPELDPTRHWVSIDVLYGGSGRFEQTRHGRGGYREQGSAGKRLRLRAREERFPSAWDGRLDLAVLLLNDAGAPWQAHEMAARVLRAAGWKMPNVTDQGVLKRWLGSPSPVLVPLAVRAVAARLGEKTNTDAATVAEAFYRAGGASRRAIISALGAFDNPKWREAFASRLAELVPRQSAAGGRFSRRALASVALLAERFPEQTGGRALLPLAGALLGTGQQKFIDLVASTARKAKAAELNAWLSVLGPLTEAQREPVLAALEDAFRGAPLDNGLVSSLVLLPGSDPQIAGMAWRVIAASATPEATLNALWTHLLDSTQETPALRVAMSSPYALGLLARAGITTEMITERLNSRPFLVALLSPETFARLAQTAPASVLLRLVAAMPDDQWGLVRGGWLRNLREGVGLADLWASLGEALRDDASDRVAARVVADPDFADALLGLDADHVEAVLAVREPAADGLLRAWSERHPTPFARDSGPLLTAATFPLPMLRTWALGRVRAVGMGMPFALRLLESDVPSSVAVGRELFDAEPAGGSHELNYALALCDSPAKPVRRWGREYVRRRWETLPRADLYRALFENPDPETQAFVATLLEEQPTPLAELADFDREVLRARNKARRAKEAVKKRQGDEATLDVATLLELARGKGTPRDAEWALSQLARRALAGEKIEGFAVEGVTG